MIDAQRACAVDGADFQCAPSCELELVEGLCVYGVAHEFQNSKQMAIPGEGRGVHGYGNIDSRVQKFADFGQAVANAQLRTRRGAD